MVFVVSIVSRYSDMDYLLEEGKVGKRVTKYVLSGTEDSPQVDDYDGKWKQKRQPRCCL